MKDISNFDVPCNDHTVSMPCKEPVDLLEWLPEPGQVPWKTTLEDSWKSLTWNPELNVLFTLAKKVLVTGSLIICPSVKPADIDVVILVVDMGITATALISNGWGVCGGQEYEEGDRIILRKGAYNLIILDTDNEYQQWLQSTELARILNLTEKADRAALFEFLREERGGKIED